MPQDNKPKHQGDTPPHLYLKLVQTTLQSSWTGVSHWEVDILGNLRNKYDLVALGEAVLQC